MNFALGYNQCSRTASIAPNRTSFNPQRPKPCSSAGDRSHRSKKQRNPVRRASLGGYKTAIHERANASEFGSGWSLHNCIFRELMLPVSISPSLEKIVISPSGSPHSSKCGSVIRIRCSRVDPDLQPVASKKMGTSESLSLSLSDRCAHNAASDADSCSTVERGTERDCGHAENSCTQRLYLSISVCNCRRMRRSHPCIRPFEPKWIAIHLHQPSTLWFCVSSLSGPKK